MLINTGLVRYRSLKLLYYETCRTENNRPNINFMQSRKQERNQVCSQRWARLENFPFPDFISTQISILVHPKQILVILESYKGKKKSSAHFHASSSFLIL